MIFVTNQEHYCSSTLKITATGTILPNCLKKKKKKDSELQGVSGQSQFFPSTLRRVQWETKMTEH